MSLSVAKMTPLPQKYNFDHNYVLRKFCIIFQDVFSQLPVTNNITHFRQFGTAFVLPIFCSENVFGSKVRFPKFFYVGNQVSRALH